MATIQGGIPTPRPTPNAILSLVLNPPLLLGFEGVGAAPEEEVVAGEDVGDDK
jgi:hypothetical protein